MRFESIAPDFTAETVMDESLMARPGVVLIYEPGQEQQAKERLTELFTSEELVYIYELPLTGASLKRSKLFTVSLEKAVAEALPAWRWIIGRQGLYRVDEMIEVLAMRMGRRLASAWEWEETIEAISRTTGLRKRLLRSMYGFQKRAIFGKHATRKPTYPWWKHIKPKRHTPKLKTL